MISFESFTMVNNMYDFSCDELVNFSSNAPYYDGSVVNDVIVWGISEEDYQ